MGAILYYMEMNNNYFGYYIINNKLYRNTDNENILFSEYVENSYIGYDYLFHWCI